MVHIFECIILYVCGIIFKQFRDSYDTLSSVFKSWNHKLENIEAFKGFTVRAGVTIAPALL